MKQKANNNLILWCVVIFLTAIVIDLVTKAVAEFYFTVLGNTDIELIPGFLTLKNTYNSGMAFSIFGEKPIAMGIIIFLTIPIEAVFLFLIVKLPKHYNPCRVGLSVVAGGAFANFVDRAYYYILNILNGNIPNALNGGAFEYVGGVRDFMDISSIGFGVCNFADYFITIGGVITAILFVVCIITDKADEK